MLIWDIVPTAAAAFLKDVVGDLACELFESRCAVVIKHSTRLYSNETTYATQRMRFDSSRESKAISAWMIEDMQIMSPRFQH